MRPLRSACRFISCGRWAWGIRRGVFPADVRAVVLSHRGAATGRPRLARLQLNIAELTKIRNPDRIAACLPSGPEYIIQVGAHGDGGVLLATCLRDRGVNASVLFDASGGHGLTPATWPEPLDDLPCGYAGGLGPDNLDHELRRLETVVGDRNVWIDMQSAVRTENRLDLAKARRCLEVSAIYVAAEP